MFPPRIPTYPKSTIADVLVPARTLIAVKLLRSIKKKADLLFFVTLSLVSLYIMVARRWQ